MPWNWVSEQWLTCMRLYSRGFMTVMYAIHRMEQLERGTRLYLYFGAVPRGAIGGTALRLGFPTLERAYRRLLPQLAAQLDRPRPASLLMPPPPLALDAEARLQSAGEALIAQGLLKEAVDKLVDHIKTGDDIDLHRIQIRERARVWKLPEVDMLKVALHATRAGLLSLSWDTICPHCRGLRDETDKLASISANGHCEVCEIDFTTDIEQAIEVTFRVHSSIREIPEQLYCSAEPYKKEHIRLQHTLAPGATVTAAPPLPRGRYTVWAGHKGGWYLDVEDDGPGEVAWQDHPEGTVIKAGPRPAIALKNDDKEDTTFTVERVTWSDDALRPGHLLSFQEFRDLFSADYIGADVKLAVGEQTLLFTDVVGSTAFYALRGDPAAFVEIKRHFDEVFAIVTRNRGAVVKTIGDAVMATFVNPVDAVRAAQQIHQAFHPRRDDTPIRLRISLNTGPCIAVRLNSNADFFGGTVNIAAKLQALAESYQIAISERTYAAAGVADMIAAELERQPGKLDALTYESKALREAVAVRRWSVFVD